MRKYIATGLTLLLLALAGVVIAQDGVGGVDSSSSSSIACTGKTDNAHPSGSVAGEVAVKGTTDCRSSSVDSVYVYVRLQKYVCNTTCYWTTVGTKTETKSGTYLRSTAAAACPVGTEKYRGVSSHKAYDSNNNQIWSTNSSSPSDEDISC